MLLLQHEINEANASADFHAALSAAELACLYAPTTMCQPALDMAGQILLQNVSEQKLSAQEVIQFANF